MEVISPFSTVCQKTKVKCKKMNFTLTDAKPFFFLFSMYFSFILHSTGEKLVIDFLSEIENTVPGKMNAFPHW